MKKYLFSVVLISCSLSASAFCEREFRENIGEAEGCVNKLLPKSEAKLAAARKEILSHKNYADDDYFKKSFDNAKNAWEAYKEKDCWLQAQMKNSGTTQGIYAALCEAEKNFAREKELRKLYLQ